MSQISKVLAAVAMPLVEGAPAFIRVDTARKQMAKAIVTIGSCTPE